MGLAILKGRNKRWVPKNARGRYGTRKTEGSQGPRVEHNKPAILGDRNKRWVPKNARGRYGTRKTDGSQGPRVEDMGLAILGDRNKRWVPKNARGRYGLANLMVPRGSGRRARQICNSRFWALDFVVL